jgi:hypothetical protein
MRPTLLLTIAGKRRRVSQVFRPSDGVFPPNYRCSARHDEIDDGQTSERA